MSDNIRHALAQFDPSDDSYWTQNGLPVVDAVRHFAGDEAISREDITAAAPGFSRENPTLEDVLAAEETITPEPAVEPPAAPPAPQPTEDTSIDTTVATTDVEVESVDAPEVEAEPESKLDSRTLSEEDRKAKLAEYKDRKKEVGKQIQEVRANMDKLKRSLNSLQIKQDAIHDVILELKRPNEEQHVIQEYLAKQRELLNERAAKILKRREEGLDPDDGVSPIDRSMRRRHSRGTKRPQFPTKVS